MHLVEIGAYTAQKDLWMLFCIYWLVFALNRKRTKRREAWHERVAYTIPVVIAVWLLYSGDVRLRWLDMRVVPSMPAAQWIGVLTTAAGIGIAFWARWHLGTNWSGMVTLKEGHELIRTGPYRSIRHPIYTGILVGALGTAVTLGEVRGFVAVGAGWLAFYMKARREESFLAQEFGSGFAEHRRQTGMFFPRFS